jgi:hypothetical protein
MPRFWISGRRDWRGRGDCVQSCRGYNDADSQATLPAGGRADMEDSLEEYL